MTTRAERRRQARAAARTTCTISADHGVVPAWCATEDDLETTRQQTHDILVQLMGDRRVGRVSWRWWTGPAAEQSLGILGQGATGENAEYYRQIGAHLRQYGGFLVVAMAPGRMQ